MDTLTTESDSEDIQKIKKEISQITTLLNGLEKIKSNDPNFLQKVEIYLKKVPSQEEIPRLYENIKKLEKLVQQSRAQKIREFQKNFTDYITNLNELKIEYKINDTYSVRVGCLEIQGKPENATISIFYNKSVIISQKPVNTSDDIKKYTKESFEKLSKSEIAENLLIDRVYQAYSTLYFDKSKINPVGDKRVPIIDLYKEIIVQLIREEIGATKSLNFRIKDFSFPEWAFLYNLDRYKNLYATIPESKRIIFETGGQAQTEKIGVVLNGLNPNDIYKKFCYVSGRGEI